MKLTSLLFISFYLFIASACIPIQAEQHVDSDLISDIASSRKWQKLLHMDGSSSEIENLDFFLTPIDKNFPLNELVATLSEIEKNQTNDSGFTFRCRYPARTEFLSTFGLTSPISALECPRLFEWIGGEDFGVSLIYADGFLGNPASFYGHLIFKFEFANSNSDLLSNSLNFGAGAADDENRLLYVLKGLLGGYQAKYTSNFFYRHSLNYKEVELRDLWKYTLQLDRSDRRLLAFHAWEVMSTQYTYYFTHRNCAYHVAKTLELVTDHDLVSSKHPFVLPVSIFKSANKSTANNRPLISDIEYLPSRQTRLRSRLNALTKQQREAFETFIATQDDAQLLAMEQNDKIQTLDALYEYIEFALTQIEVEDELTKQDWRNLKRQIQLLRIKLPAASAQANNEQLLPQLPHVGHRPSLLRLNYGQFDDAVYTGLTFRPAFYDLYSSGGGILPNSSLKMLELSLRAFENTVELSKAELLTIETYPTDATGLEYDHDLAWKMRLGLERNYIDGQDNSLEWFADLGAGKAYSLADQLVAFVMLNTRIQTPDPSGNRVFMQPTVGFLFGQEYFRIGCQLIYQASIDNFSTNRRRQQSCEASILQHETWDIRLKYEDYYSSAWSVSMSWYW